MADAKISDLPAAAALAGTETVPGVQSAATVKMTVDQIVTRAGATLAPKAAPSFTGGITVGKARILDDSPFLTGGNVFGSTGNPLAVGTQGAQDLSFYTQGVLRSRILSTGQHEIRAGNAIRLYKSDDSQFATLQFGGSGANNVSLNYNLEVPFIGVGMAPTYNVDVRGPTANDTPNIVLRYSSGPNDGVLGYLAIVQGANSSATGSSRFWFMNASDNAAVRTLALNSNGGSAFGNVAIGKNSASQRLEVSGNITLTPAASVSLTLTPTGAASQALIRVSGAGTGQGLLAVDAPSGVLAALRVETAGSLRWTFGKSTGAEGGANAGSDWEGNAYSDAAAFLRTWLQVNRANGTITLDPGSSSGLSLQSARIVANNRIQYKAYTFATLPSSPAKGDHAYITDPLAAPVYNAAAAGGGASGWAEVGYDGAAWRYT